MIRGVLFDLGGTLLEVPDPAGIVKSFLDDQGISKTLQEVATAVEEAERSFEANYYVGSGYWKEWNLRILAKLGVVSNRDRIASFIDSHWFEAAKVRPYPESIEVLDAVKAKGVTMGAVTNGISSDIPRLVDKPGLSGYFKATVSADMAGRRKPNPRIFLHAAKALGLPPSDVVFVGDDPDLDYRASESVGMLPVLVNRGAGRALVKNVVPDLRGVLTFL